MFIRYLGKKINGNTYGLYVCEVCNLEYRRINKNLRKMEKNPYYDSDYCPKCWRKILNNRPEYKNNMSKAIQKAYELDPSIGNRISKSLIANKVNVGDKNGMKQLEARKKVSEARKRMFQDIELRKEYSKKTKKAWEDGKFKNVRVGQCKWFDYEHSNGKIYKVQGTWELAFIEWVDLSGIVDFKCHRGRVPYSFGGVDKNWYPDFIIHEWNNAYIDIKCRHFYNEDKFLAIKQSNPKLNVKLLFKEDLLKLGVKI